MNREYIKKLFKNGRIGKIIKLMSDNVFNWSIDDFEHMLRLSKTTGHYDIFYHIAKKCLYNNLKYDINIDISDKCLVDITCSYAYKYKYSDIIKYIILISGAYKKILYRICYHGDVNLLKYVLLSGYDIGTNIFEDGISVAYKYAKINIFNYIITPLIMNKYTYKCNFKNIGMLSNRNFSIINYLLTCTKIHELYPNTIYNISKNRDRLSELRHMDRWDYLDSLEYKIIYKLIEDGHRMFPNIIKKLNY